jgi:glutamate--cysteine ligase
MVPHLITALTGPLNELEQRVLDTMPSIERWFRLEWMEHTPPFYASVDLRNAGFKLAPVDNDLFPSCWNNLTPAMLPLAVQAAMAAIEKICPEARNLLIVPSPGLRSTAYLANLAQLRSVFQMAGLNVRFGSISPDLKKPLTLELPDGQTLVLEPVVRNRGRLGVKDFDPCTILLNNGLVAGVPGILEDLHQQYLLPPLHASASQRQRSTYFKNFEEVAKRFGKLIGVDPWLFTPISDKAGSMDLARPEGLEALTACVDGVLLKVRRKYKEYGIKEKPFVVIKSNQAGSGAGVVSVRDSRDLVAALERAQAGKSPAGVRELIVQEGVLTKERVNDAVAEPVVYTMDRYVVGGFYRVHAEQGVEEDLSAPGSSHVPLAFDESTHLPQPGVRPGVSAPNRFYMYGVVGRLATLSASYEIEATDPEAERYD